MTLSSRQADDARLEEIEFSSPVHLTLDQLELADLPFGLAVGPTRGERGAHRCFVLRDAVRQRGNEAGLGVLDPGLDFVDLSATEPDLSLLKTSPLS